MLAAVNDLLSGIRLRKNGLPLYYLLFNLFSIVCFKISTVSNE